MIRVLTTATLASAVFALAVHSGAPAKAATAGAAIGETARAADLVQGRPLSTPEDEGGDSGSRGSPTATISRSAQLAPIPAALDAPARVAEAVGVVRRAAYRSGEVDWPELEIELRALASTAADTVDMLPIYARLLAALGDNHSFVQVDQALRDAYKARYGAEFDAANSRPAPSSPFMGRRETTGRLIPIEGRTEQLALVTVPKVFGGGARALAYASDLHGHVAGAASSACAYIVDLRGNVGGNVWPMKLGLTALLGQDYDRNDAYARIQDGAATVIAGDDAGMVFMKLDNWTPLPRLEETPVAVLIDDATGSSGEGVALTFKGRSRTRFFGQTTAGVASANEGFELSDGVNLVVTVGMMADRNGTTYPDGVTPDEIVGPGEGSPADSEDAVIEAARLWLASLSTCGG